VALTNRSSAGRHEFRREWRAILRAVWIGGVALVFGCSCLPASSPPMQVLEALPVGDKVQHAAAYLALAFVPALHEDRWTVFTLSVCLVAMGVVLEFGQILAEGRYFSVGDMAADLLGVLLGLFLSLVARTWIGRIVPEF
jgi:VanZ family protein